MLSLESGPYTGQGVQPDSGADLDDDWKWERSAVPPKNKQIETMDVRNHYGKQIADMWTSEFKTFKNINIETMGKRFIELNKQFMKVVLCDYKNWDVSKSNGQIAKLTFKLFFVETLLKNTTDKDMKDGLQHDKNELLVQIGRIVRSPEYAAAKNRVQHAERANPAPVAPKKGSAARPDHQQQKQPTAQNKKGKIGFSWGRKSTSSAQSAHQHQKQQPNAQKKRSLGGLLSMRKKG